MDARHHAMWAGSIKNSVDERLYHKIIVLCMGSCLLLNIQSTFQLELVQRACKESLYLRDKKTPKRNWVQSIAHRFKKNKACLSPHPWDGRRFLDRV